MGEIISEAITGRASAAVDYSMQLSTLLEAAPVDRARVIVEDSVQDVLRDELLFRMERCKMGLEPSQDEVVRLSRADRRCSSSKPAFQIDPQGICMNGWMETYVFGAIDGCAS